MTVGWARFCAHADTKPRGQTINLSAHPTLFSEHKFTLGDNPSSLTIAAAQAVSLASRSARRRRRTDTPYCLPTAPGFTIKRILQIPRRPVNRAPHVRGRALIKAQAFFRLAEVAANDIGELFQLHMHIRVE